MSYVIVILIISILISLYVIIPLLRGLFIKGPQSDEINSLDELNHDDYYDLIKKRDLLINEIRDIDFDFGLGKLNRRDYNEIKDKYRYKTAAVLKEIDEIEDIKIDSNKSDSIENEILQVKNSIQGSN